MNVPGNTERITLLYQDSSTPSSVPNSEGRIVPAAMITGLEFGDDLLLSPVYGLKPVSERELYLPAPMISRLVSFYETHLTCNPKEVPPWNCHSFVGALLGNEFELADQRRLEPGAVALEVDPSQLQCGKPYIIKDLSGSVLHSVIGIDDPSECLSAVGMCRPLKIMDTQDAVSLWGQTIHEVGY